MLHDQLPAQQADLAHVEASLKLFQPDIDFSGARISRKPGRNAAAYGEMSKAVRDVLRDATGTRTSRQIQQAVMTLRGLDQDDDEMATTMRKRISATLRNLKRRGSADCKHGVWLAMEWWLVASD